MRKLSPAAFLASGAIIFSGLFMSTALVSNPAFAEEDDETSSTSQEVEQEEEDEEEEENSHQDKKHQEIEQKFGKEGKLTFPPIVIRPIQEASVGASFVAVNPALQGAEVGDLKGTVVYPERNVKIDISKVNFTRKTPADAFIQASQVGLYVMGAGALALSAIAVSRAIRRK